MFGDTLYIPGGKYNYDGSLKYPDGYPDDIFDRNESGNYKYEEPIGVATPLVDPNRDTSNDRDMGPIPMPRSLHNDQITPEEAYKMFPDLRNVREQPVGYKPKPVDPNRDTSNDRDMGPIPMPRSTGNKIGTSDTNVAMARDQRGRGRDNARNFAQEYSVALPPTMGGYRKKDMVDLELGREGRISPFVAVGQSKQSPNLGFINDDARGVFGGEMRSYVPGGKGGINVSIRPNIQNTNTFNPQNTFNPETSATSNPTLQTAGGNIDESTAQGGGPYTAGRDITPIGTGGTATTGESGDVISDANITTTADNQSTATTGTGSGTTTGATTTGTNTGTTTGTGNTTTTTGNTTTTNGTDTTTTTTTTPRFSTDFATEQDAKDWINTYYQDNLGRDANFDSQFSDASTNASYWLNNLSKGIEDKSSVQSNIDLNDEAWLNQQYNTLLNRDAELGGGRDYWMDQLSSGNQSRDQVISNIKLSDEYKNLNPVQQSDPGPQTQTSYGGGTQDNNYITDQAAYDADQAAEAANITHSTSADVTGQTDAYLNAYANLTESADQSAADTIAQTKAVTDSTTSGAIANQQQTTVDDWLSDFYTEHGINQGKVDQGGRDYWTEQLGSKDKATVERDILWAAANN
jgi:hypothetical protein